MITWEEIKYKVRPRFLSIGKGTTEQLKSELDKIELYYQEFVDFIVGYVILSDRENPYEDGKEIYKDMMSDWNIDGDILHKQACDNMAFDGYGIYYGSNLGGTFETTNINECELAMFTNKYFRYGATGILNKELCKSILGNEKYCMIPISIHELAFLKNEGRLCPDLCIYLKAVVANGNKYVITSDTILSDGVYMWDNGEIERVD